MSRLDHSNLRLSRHEWVKGHPMGSIDSSCEPLGGWINYAWKSPNNGCRRTTFGQIMINRKTWIYGHNSECRVSFERVWLTRHRLDTFLASRWTANSHKHSLRLSISNANDPTFVLSSRNANKKLRLMRSQYALHLLNCFIFLHTGRELCWMPNGCWALGGKLQSTKAHRRC